MAPNTQLVQSNVQRILADNFNSVELWKSGFTLRHNSARVFVGIVEQENRVLISLTAPIVFDCPRSPELYRHVAVNGGDYFFGHISVDETEEGTANLYFKHTLLGDYLDEAELVQAMFGLLGTADDLDDEFAKQFGGKRFHEDD